MGLPRRRDLAEVIGRALVAVVGGLGHRRIAGTRIPPSVTCSFIPRSGPGEPYEWIPAG